VTITIGVDPGGSGAIAATRDRQLIFVKDMPVHGGIISAPGVTDILDYSLKAWRSSQGHFHHTPPAWVEDVHSMPRQGVASSFKFGQAHGTVLGVLGALRIPVHLVTPAKWKRDLGLGSDKAKALEMARRLFPTAELSLKRHIGRAEALLIAEWGRRNILK